MKKIHQYRFEIILGVLVLSLISFIVYPPKNEYLLYLTQFATIADALLIFFVLRKLWRNKWKSLISKGIQKVFQILVKKVFRFFEKTNLFRKNKNILKGETKTIQSFSFLKKEKKKAVKPSKWSQMQSPRDKMRYLYRHMISQRIHHGERIYSTDTPLEILKKNESQEEKVVFDLYLDYRYDDRTSPDEQEIQDIKDRYYPKLK